MFGDGVFLNLGIRAPILHHFVSVRNQQIALPLVHDVFAALQLIRVVYEKDFHFRDFRFCYCFSAATTFSREVWVDSVANVPVTRGYPRRINTSPALASMRRNCSSDSLSFHPCTKPPRTNRPRTEALRGESFSLARIFSSELLAMAWRTASGSRFRPAKSSMRRNWLSGSFRRSSYFKTRRFVVPAIGLSSQEVTCRGQAPKPLILPRKKAVMNSSRFPWKRF